MPASDVAPGDDDVEQAVVGDMLNLPHAVPELAAVLSGSDFHNPTYGAAFDILVAAHREGREVDGRILGVELQAAGRSLRPMVRLVDGYDPENLHVWSQPRGMNVATRQGYRNLEAAVRAAQPALLLMGPLYKVYDHGPRETDEDAARRLMDVLDDLRTRFGFAVVIEHHAPHGDPRQRVMRPFGWSGWKRWPELGFGLEQAGGKGKTSELILKRWRSDRDLCSWPERFRMSQPWPWTGVWPDGTFQQEQF